MPVNAGPEYFNAEKRYLSAKTREEKIAALEDMIKFLPKHKSSENQLAMLKKRLSKLRKETTRKSSSRPRFVIKKEGAAQVCIVGLTNCGKSSLLNALTNTRVEVASYPYTTKEPKVGMMLFEDVQIQMVEIPSTFDSDVMSIAHGCDLILILLDVSRDLLSQTDEITKILSSSNLDGKKVLFVANKSDLKQTKEIFSISAEYGTNLAELKSMIWSRIGMIRVYTKSPGKPKEHPPITLPKVSTVREVAKKVHKDLMENFKFARVFNSTSFSGHKVGLDYKLNDLDVVEIHTG